MALLVCASLAGAYFHIKQIGWDERDVVAQQEAQEASKYAAALSARRVVVSERVVTQFRDRVKIVREAGEEVIREVVRYIPVTTPDLPGGFRVLHDAAALGQIPRTPTGADATSAAPVPVTTATETIASNYSACRLNAEQLASLQEWATRQRKLELRRRQLGGDP